MHSTFKIKKPEGAMCTNMTLRNLGTLQGIFGAEIDRSGGRIDVSHTDEIGRTQIVELLRRNGYDIEEEPGDDDNSPSIWGCAL